MSEVWVLRDLFQVQAAVIDWGLEAELLAYEGPQQPAGLDFAPLQIRWLLHPSVGLPRQPFVLARNRHPGGNLTTQQLANLPGWEPIETVGLPVDDSWHDTGYDLSFQGPVAAPLAPRDAALRRLLLGAPRIGWTRLTLTLPSGPRSLPDWEPVVLRDYLADLIGSPVVRGVHAMLRDRPDPRQHAAYTDPAGKVVGPGTPRLLLGGATAFAGQDQPTSTAWHPLGLLLLSAGVDPLASLALGFGTAILSPSGARDLYRVSVRHELRSRGRVHEVELADVVTVRSRLPAPDPPTKVGAALVARTKPQVLDGPSLDTVGITWRRALNPAFAHPGADAPDAISYAIGRFDVERGRSQILLTRRAERVHGFQPFVASAPPLEAPVLFADHRARVTTFGDEVVGDPRGEDHVYAVAAQDVFGRWSQWVTTPYSDSPELPQAPSIYAVTVDPAGTLTVDFGWDWSDRRPEFAELVASYEDDPATILLTARVEFGGRDQPLPGAHDVVALAPDLVKPVVFGSAQDPDPAQPGTRFYRLRAADVVDLGGRPRRVVQVRARGQCHLHQRVLPGFNVSALGPPYAVEVYDHKPPDRPGIVFPPEVPRWATLSDGSGVSRATIGWTAAPRATGYVVYEATETTLLAALRPPQPGPDLAQPLTARLATLRGADLPALRRQFRRITQEPIGPTSFEVSLPRGSTVLHLYAVTAVSANNQESEWPDRSHDFIAVAAPHTSMPRPPSLEARIDSATATPVVHVRVLVDGEPPVGDVDLHRLVGDAHAPSLDTMGPPITSLTTGGTTRTFTDAVAPSWHRIWYRAVAWSQRDDQNGLVEARSAPSSAVSVLAPPAGLPPVTDLRVNEPGSSNDEVLVSWTLGAPFRVTAFGPHRTVVEVRDMGGQVRERIEGRLDTLEGADSLAALPAPDPDHRRIVRVPTESGVRLYAWLPRPAVDQSCRIEAKVIDPLGRIGRAGADVPALASTELVIDTIDPDNGPPGGEFTIFGSNLVLPPGSRVVVIFDVPPDPDGTEPGGLSLVAPVVSATSTAIVATVPLGITQECTCEVTVSRGDGAEQGAGSFDVTQL